MLNGYEFGRVWWNCIALRDDQSTAGDNLAAKGPDFRFVNGQAFRFGERIEHAFQAVEIEGRMSFSDLHRLGCRSWLVPLSLVLCQALSPMAFAQSATSGSTAFTQSLAATASADEAVAAWYRETGYDTLWTGAEDADRRTAFLAAITRAADHGLPVARYDAAVLTAALQAAETEGDRGRNAVGGATERAARAPFPAVGFAYGPHDSARDRARAPPLDDSPNACRSRIPRRRSPLMLGRCRTSSPSNSTPRKSANR